MVINSNVGWMRLVVTVQVSPVWLQTKFVFLIENVQELHLIQLYYNNKPFSIIIFIDDNISPLNGLQLITWCKG